jgi:hypothetical protein
MWLIYIYIVASFFVAWSAATSAGFVSAFYALSGVGVFIAAGSGLKASLFGERSQKIAGPVIAAALAALAHWLSIGFSVGLLGAKVSGPVWGWAGFLLCLIFVNRKIAGVPEKPHEDQFAEVERIYNRLAD